MSQRRTMIVTGAAVAATSAILGVAAATAEPPPGQVPKHQHYVVTADGDLVPVGPNACEDGPSIQFDKFHLNGHIGEPGQHGVVVGRGCPT